MRALFSPSRSPLLLVFKNNHLPGSHDLPSPASPSPAPDGVQPWVQVQPSLLLLCQSSPTLQTQPHSSGPRPLPLHADATHMNLSILSQTATPPAPRLSQCGLSFSEVRKFEFYVTCCSFPHSRPSPLFCCSFLLQLSCAKCLPVEPNIIS